MSTLPLVHHFVLNFYGRSIISKAEHSVSSARPTSPPLAHFITLTHPPLSRPKLQAFFRLSHRTVFPLPLPFYFLWRPGSDERALRTLPPDNSSLLPIKQFRSASMCIVRANFSLFSHLTSSRARRPVFRSPIPARTTPRRSTGSPCNIPASRHVHADVHPSSQAEKARANALH